MKRANSDRAPQTPTGGGQQSKSSGNTRQTSETLQMQMNRFVLLPFLLLGPIKSSPERLRDSLQEVAMPPTWVTVQVHGAQRDARETV